jgi:hypothetical protein
MVVAGIPLVQLAVRLPLPSPVKIVNWPLALLAAPPDIETTAIMAYVLFGAQSLRNTKSHVNDVVGIIDSNIGLVFCFSITLGVVGTLHSLQSRSDFAYVKQITIAKVKLLSECRRRNTQHVIQRDVLDSEDAQPILVAFRYGGDDQDRLLPIEWVEGLQGRVLSYNLKVSTICASKQIMSSP